MKTRPAIPHLTECIASIEAAGYTYSHKSIARQLRPERSCVHPARNPRRLQKRLVT